LVVADITVFELIVVHFLTMKNGHLGSLDHLKLSTNRFQQQLAEHPEIDRDDRFQLDVDAFVSNQGSNQVAHWVYVE
jgi:hypothetical protein